MKQYEAVIETLDKLGGVATLGDLNSEVFKIQECEWKTKTPFASIRRIVQQTKGIYKIKPGLYGLEKYRKQNEERGIITGIDRHTKIKLIPNSQSKRKIECFSLIAISIWFQIFGRNLFSRQLRFIFIIDTEAELRTKMNIQTCPRINFQQNWYIQIV